jgi:hypothetical protein
MPGWADLDVGACAELASEFLADPGVGAGDENRVERAVGKWRPATVTWVWLGRPAVNSARRG